MGDSRNLNFFSSERNKRRENLRKTLRVIDGGKQDAPAIDSQDLMNDRFLRDHFLEGRNKQPELNFEG